MLAGARTPTGKDDRAVSWTKIIAGLSALETRAHYLLYREWADRLQGRVDLNLGLVLTARSVRLDVELQEFEGLLNADDGMEPDDATAYAIPGLMAADLLTESSCGPRSEVAQDSPFEEVLRVQPTMRGCELYGWAQGLPGLTATAYTSKAKVFDTNPAIPRLHKVALTKPAATTHGSLGPRLMAAQPARTAPPNATRNSSSWSIASSTGFQFRGAPPPRGTGGRSNCRVPS